MARRFQRSNQRRSSTPNRDWFGFVTTNRVTVSANSKVLLATFVLSNPGIDETVLRSVGMISVLTDAPAGGEQQIGSFVLGVFNNTAVAAGIASLPDPVTDVGDDSWFIYQAIAQNNLVNTAVGVVESVQYHFDSKAKRIVSNGFSIAVIAANAHATEGFTINVNLRMLAMVRGTG